MSALLITVVGYLTGAFTVSAITSMVTAWISIQKIIKEANDLCIGAIYCCNKYYSSADWNGIYRTINSDGSGSSRLKEENWLGETISDKAKEALDALNKFNLFYIKNKHALDRRSEIFRDVYTTYQNLVFSRAKCKYTWENIGEFRKDHAEAIEKVENYKIKLIKSNVNWRQKFLIWISTKALEVIFSDDFTSAML